jgi:hypothetical protein
VIRGSDVGSIHWNIGPDDIADRAVLEAAIAPTPQWSVLTDQIQTISRSPNGVRAKQFVKLHVYGNMNGLYRGVPARLVSELPAYTQHLDVCMLCYKVNDYTKFIYPLKLHEYLASGRPIVGSPIRAFQEFGHVVKLAGTVEEWSRALGACLEPVESSPSRVAERRNVARRYDWNDLCKGDCQNARRTTRTGIHRGVPASGD